MENSCVPRPSLFGRETDSCHEFVDIYDVVEESFLPDEIYGIDDLEDLDADGIEACRTIRTTKTYVQSVCKYCGNVVCRP